jgi:2-phospho-L-lactate/phosphoenolpyruvate guanylyltransferase
MDRAPSPAPPSQATDAPPWLVLPFRSITDGKRRLAGLLAERERHALNLLMLRRALRLAQRHPGCEHTIVVTRCLLAYALAQAAGAHAVLQQGRGLNDAVRLGVGAAAARGAADLLVVSCDLPLAHPAALQQLWRHGRSTGGVVLATDRQRQGTNALYLPAVVPFPFAYCPRSRSRHAQAAAAAGLRFDVLEETALAFDIDTPQDYLAWQAAAARPRVHAGTAMSAE